MYQAFLTFGPIAGRTRIFHGGHVVSHRIDGVIGGVVRLHQAIVGFQLGVAHMHAEILGNGAQLIESGASN
jgi:hypothetical protein